MIHRARSIRRSKTFTASGRNEAGAFRAAGLLRSLDAEGQGLLRLSRHGGQAETARRSRARDCLHPGLRQRRAKLSLFRDVRAGKVRVLFGSTQKMGSGTNVQERLIALHHLDAPWRPADVEQREGRILAAGQQERGPWCRFTATSPKARLTPTCGRPWRRRRSSSRK
jgi:hypothetical protein